MKGALKHRPSPAMVVALLALCVSLGGVSYGALKLKANSVKTKNLKAGAVTEAKIAGGAVTTGKIGNGAVTGGKIGDGAVNSAKIADGAVNAAKIGDGQVGSAELGAGSVTPEKFFLSTVRNVNLASIAANDCFSDSVVTAGILPTDRVFISTPATLESGIVVFGEADTNSLTIDFCNIKVAASGNPGSQPFGILVMR